MVNFNGILEAQDSNIITQNRAFLYGDAVFETVKIVNDKILFLEDHYFRLMAAMRIVRMEIPMNFTMDYFEEQILPVLTPQARDPAHPFPFIPNTGFSLALELERESDHRTLKALLPIPQQIARFVALPGKPGEHRFLPLEELLLLHLDMLFPGYTDRGHCIFRVLRDSDLEVEDEAEDLVREFETALKRRRRGEVIRLKLSAGAPEELRALIKEELGVKDDEMVELRGMLGIADLKELVVSSRPDLLWPPFTPRVPERVQDNEGDMFAAIKQKDILLHHPYETFDLVIRFLEQAARDPNVLAIKQTLYRTSWDSPIFGALCEAAEAGKSVTALVELKARFDEARNVSWAKELEYAGVHVTYGLVGLKTHSKCVLVVRNDPDKMRRYVHIGTGNYNASTARLYEDIGFFTCEDAIGSDATELFNFLTGYAQEPDYQVLLVAPRQLRNRIIALIDKEATFGDAGKISFKMNSISDPQIIEALYRASGAGVKITLIVRGICCIRAGVPGMSENISVRSILGRYLEHSRIYRFEHGLEDNEPLHLIGSADMMGRNLDGRVEVLAPLTHPKHRMWLDTVLGFLLDEESTHFSLNGDNTWTRVGTFAESGDPQKKLHEWVVATQVR